jgi:hypothetical protein
MTQKSMDGAARTPEAATPAQRVTLRIPTHMAAPSHALILREGPSSLTASDNVCALDGDDLVGDDELRAAGVHRHNDPASSMTRAVALPLPQDVAWDALRE